MKVKSAPMLHSYCSQGSTFTDDWMRSLPLDWHNELAQDQIDNYYCWPQFVRDAYNAARDTHCKELQYVAEQGKKYVFDDVTLYIGDERFFASTRFYDHGRLSELLHTDKFDSVETAVYAFKNDYEEWQANHEKSWQYANLLSSAEPTPPDSPELQDFILDYCDIYGDYSEQGERAARKAFFSNDD